MNKRYLSLDSLRGIFVFFVVIHHYYLKYGGGDLSNVPYPNILSCIYNYGWIGVEFFFMLSGFGIANAYNDRIYDMKLTTFLKGRLSKIFPLCALTTICNMCFNIRNINILKAVLSIFLIQFGWFNATEKPYNSVEWFVNVLIICYLFYYLIAKLYVKHTNLYYLAIFGLYMLGMGCIICDIDAPLLYVWNGRGYMAFSGGLMLKEIVEKCPRNKVKILSAIGMGVICYFVIGASQVGVIDFFGGVTDMRVLLSLIVFPSIFLFLSIDSVISRFLANRILLYFGKCSMSVFLWHPFIYRIIFDMNKKHSLNIPFDDIRYMVMIIVVIYVFSIVSYELLEKRLIKYLVNKWNKL